MTPSARPLPDSSEHSVRNLRDSRITGAIAGAVACGTIRAGFSFYNLETATLDSAESAVRGILAFFVLLLSGGIGMLVGAIAGVSCDERKGAAIGAVLSVGIFILFLTPFQVCFSLLDDLLDNSSMTSDFSSFTAIYVIQRGIAGALGGAFGGFIGRRQLQEPGHATRSLAGPKDELD